MLANSILKAVVMDLPCNLSGCAKTHSTVHYSRLQLKEGTVSKVLCPNLNASLRGATHSLRKVCVVGLRNK